MQLRRVASWREMADGLNVIQNGLAGEFGRYAAGRSIWKPVAEGRGEAAMAVWLTVEFKPDAGPFLAEWEARLQVERE